MAVFINYLPFKGVNDFYCYYLNLNLLQTMKSIKDNEEMCSVCEAEP